MIDEQWNPSVQVPSSTFVHEAKTINNLVIQFHLLAEYGFRWLTLVVNIDVIH